ncbi:MAG TPA: outer membrane beta-barrel domain-containing protein [Polyangia bacterium]
MKRRAVCLFVSILIGGAGGTRAWAAGSKDKAADTKDADAAGAGAGTGADAAGGGEAPPPDTSGDLDLSDNKASEEAAATIKTSSTLTWQDIVVIPRKRFLKGGRFEFSPFAGTSINDILIQHYVFGLDLNFFITDAFSIGLQGDYYVKQLTDRESLIGLQYNRIPTLNRYLWSGLLNFGYVPAYGKFALFNKSIVHWEIVVSGGVGITQTEIIPRNISFEPFKTNAITPDVGIGSRFFLFDWLTVNYMFRDYIILDKYEPLNRSADLYKSGADAKAHADSKLVNNIMFYVGVGMFLPTSFQYKTPR